MENKKIQIQEMKKKFKMKIGNTLILVDDVDMSARIGAKAILKKFDPPYVVVEWINKLNTGLRKGQMDGEYYPESFKVIDYYTKKRTITKTNRNIIPRRIQREIKKLFNKQECIIRVSDRNRQPRMIFERADLVIGVEPKGKSFKILKNRYGRTDK